MNDVVRKKYFPNLTGLHAMCDANYACLMKLLPEVDEEQLSYQFGGRDELQYKIAIVECSRYTTMLEIKQVHPGLPTFLKASMQVRLYHDARMAEVISSQHISRLKPSYGYPNARMHQRNEKEMVNYFLSEWLHFCQQKNIVDPEKA
ncbi:MAG: DUF1249 domain-containing protein [Aestuariibacter sp.]